MRDSFSAGVLVGLLKEHIYFDWVAGISAGSTCALNYLSRDSIRAKKSFVDFAQEPQFGNWKTLIQGKGYFNSEWIYEIAPNPGQALPFDFQTYLQNPAKIKIGSLRCETGEMVYWGRDELADMPAILKKLRASSSMPILMPFPKIDGIYYCDGALGPSGGIALDAAKADGFKKFLVVLTRTRNYLKAPLKYKNIFKLLMAKYPAVYHGLLQRPTNYNNTREELFSLEAEGKAKLIFPDVMPITNLERDQTKLQAMFNLGQTQVRREIEAIKEFIDYKSEI